MFSAGAEVLLPATWERGDFPVPQLWSRHGRLSGVFPRLYALSMDPRSSVQQAWHRAWAPALPEALSDQRVTELLRLQELLADQSLSEATQDAWVWNGPNFTVRAVYRLLRDQGAPEDRRFLQRCRLVWKRRLPLKIKIFAWLLLRRRLMTRSLRQRLVPDSPVDCPMCARAMEDCPHLFFTCPFAQEVWLAVNVGRIVTTSEEALWRSLSGGAFRRETEWLTIFATLWSIWTHRNEVIFRGCTPSVDATLHNARGFASFWFRGGLGPSISVPL